MGNCRLFLEDVPPFQSYSILFRSQSYLVLLSHLQSFCMSFALNGDSKSFLVITPCHHEKVLQELLGIQDICLPLFKEIFCKYLIPKVRVFLLNSIACIQISDTYQDWSFGKVHCKCFGSKEYSLFKVNFWTLAYLISYLHWYS